ncbi:hypothetical protein [Pontixanthobacter sp. CEM42]|uniref:hypothetical protein n=1 Tax=Pontixanthobacter sp. CEM42 TaxID=2792077 RepID=UPI001ADF40D2|nr:hypothetical protein [Pontixanthobacter sp. CEM42]
MSIKAVGDLNPDAALRIEVGCILIDPLFMRSPIQAKLLNFLCERAIDGDQDLTQYAIAVDGLGKPDDYDLQNDSYPRVQVSRLRSNLANYYSRQEPLNEHCVYIKQGDYRLRLGSREMAYPSGKLRAHSEPASATDSPSEIDPNQVSPLATQRSSRRSRKLVATVVVTLAAIVSVGLFYGFQKETPDGTQLPPAIELMLVTDQQSSARNDIIEIEEDVARLARLQLNQSFVSNLIESSHSEMREEDYLVKIDLGEGTNSPEAAISLRSDQDEVLFVASVPFHGDREAFLRSISSNLVYLIAPSGVIAKRELSLIHGEPQSAYQCFISIEGNRARAGKMTALLNSCVDRYPNDKFASFWYARKAYMAYQREIAAGLSVSRKSPAWHYVSQALQIDEHNAFANFVAAKVSAAESSCEASRMFISRAMERGSSYPSLMAASEAEAGGCSAASKQEADAERKDVEALIAQNPAPDVLLHVHMMIAALTIEDTALAVDAADKLVIGEASSSVERASTLLRRAILEPGFFAEHEKETREMVALFVWNESARRKITGRLKAK